MNETEKSERRRAQWRAYYAANREKVLSRMHNRYMNHREEILEKNRAEYPERKRELQHKRYSDPAKRMRSLVNYARYRALKIGIDIDESLRDVLSSNPPSECSCCKSMIDYSSGRGSDRRNSPSLDRLVPEKGYTIDNTVVICYRCNRLKSDASIEDMEKILTYMRRHLLRNAPFTKYVIQPSSAN